MPGINKPSHIEVAASTRVEKPVVQKIKKAKNQIGQELTGLARKAKSAVSKRVLALIEHKETRKSNFCKETQRLMGMRLAHKTKIGQLAQQCLNDTIVELNITKAEYEALDFETKKLVDRYTQMRFTSCEQRAPGWSWCAIAMNDLGKKAGILPQNSNFTAVFQHVQFAVDNGTWHETPKGKILAEYSSDMKEGDFIIFRHAGQGEHIGMIERIDGDTLTTIEGNANLNGQNTTDGFIRKQYHLRELTPSKCRGFIDNHTKPELTAKNAAAASKSNDMVKF